MQQSKAYVIKNTTRNLKATMSAHKAQQQRRRRLATIRAIEFISYRRFDRDGVHSW